MKFEELNKDYQEIAIEIMINRLQMWEEQNQSEDTNYIAEKISMDNHKDYIIDSCKNVLWFIEVDGTLDYELN